MKSAEKNFMRIFYSILAVVALGLIVGVFISDVRCSKLNQSQLRKIEFQGTYRLNEDEREKTLTIEELHKIGNAERLILKGHFREDIKEREQVFVYLRRIGVEIYQNGSLIYSYGNDKTHMPMLRAGGNVWGNFYSDGISKNDEITMIFHNPYPKNSSKIYELFLRRLYVGDRMQLFQHMAVRVLPAIISCMWIFLMGIVLFAAIITLKIMHVDGLDYLFCCGILFLVSSLWILIDASYISLIFPYETAWDVLETLVFISIPTISLHYGRYFMVTGIKKVLKIMEYVLLAQSAIYLILQTTGILDGEIMQEIYRRLLPFIIGIIFICLILEIRKNPYQNAKLVLGSGIILIIFGVVGYISYAVTQAYGADLFSIGLTMFTIVQYVIVMKAAKESYEKSRKARKLENELMESKIAIMLSQIQPHFLYNSISCIQELCLSEPQKAHDALAQFAHFLRGNMDSLSSKRPIPFEQELRHVKNYLALEKIRFEDRLSVEYRIDAEGFFIPALTIQPIVENAVRYGISKKKAGGTVIIAAKETDEEVMISISDDGVGFDTAQDVSKKDNRSHIGMKNVKERLRSQCNGRMEVTSTIGKGTTVKIILPKR